MKQIGAQNSNTKKKIAAWARDIGLKGGYAMQRGDKKPTGWWIGLLSTISFLLLTQKQHQKLCLILFVMLWDLIVPESM